MRDIKKTHTVFVLLLPLLLMSCATTYAPKEWLESPDHVQADVHGGWIYLEYYSGAEKRTLAGELIAVSKDSIYIANETFHEIPLSSVEWARLVTYESNAKGMALWGLLGTLSTITHGFGFLLTAPLWVIASSITTVLRSYEPIIEYPKHKWSHFVPFARYPQGLPVGIDRNQIKMKKPRKGG